MIDLLCTGYEWTFIYKHNDQSICRSQTTKLRLADRIKIVNVKSVQDRFNNCHILASLFINQQLPVKWIF